MVKSGLEKNNLKFHGGLQRYLLTYQANSAFLGRFFCTGQQQLWRPSLNFKIIFSRPLFTIIFKPKMVSNLHKNFLCIAWHQKPTVSYIVISVVFSNLVCCCCLTSSIYTTVLWTIFSIYYLFNAKKKDNKKLCHCIVLCNLLIAESAPWSLDSFIHFLILPGLTLRHVLFCWTVTQLTIKVLIEGNVSKSVADYWCHLKEDGFWEL